MGQDDGVYVVGVLADGVDDPAPRARIDEHGALAQREISVTGERLGVGGNGVDLHTAVVWRRALECTDRVPAERTPVGVAGPPGGPPQRGAQRNPLLVDRPTWNCGIVG